MIFICFALFLSVVCGHTIEQQTNHFKSFANNATAPVFTDKVSGHWFHLMYGTFLQPYVKHMHSINEKIKFMEVGMGCNFRTVAQKKGVDIWRALFNNNDEIWMAELKRDCVDFMKKAGHLPHDVKVVFGDQNDTLVLKSWVKETGGKFNVFIDDGGHSNMQIYNTFQVMWEQVLPGGFYFIEDLQVSRTKGYEDSWGQFIMADIIKDWTEQLLMPYSTYYKHKLPKGVKFIFCQAEACLIGKCGADDTAWCSGRINGK